MASTKDRGDRTAISEHKEKEKEETPQIANPAATNGKDISAERPQQSVQEDPGSIPPQTFPEIKGASDLSFGSSESLYSESSADISVKTQAAAPTARLLSYDTRMSESVVPTSTNNVPAVWAPVSPSSKSISFDPNESAASVSQSPEDYKIRWKQAPVKGDNTNEEDGDDEDEDEQENDGDGKKLKKIKKSVQKFRRTLTSETLLEDDQEEVTILLEIAWEVAWKVGGIYTVLRTKVPFTVRAWGPLYALAGIYNAEAAATEFEEIDPMPLVASVLRILREEKGIRVYFGRWLVPGYPRVFLFDLKSSQHELPGWRDELMPGFANPSDAECNDAIVFGHQVAFLIEAFARHCKVVAHFHEWLSGVGLIMTKRMKVPNVSTVFTTHATLLGRYLCAGRVAMYDVGFLESINVDREAGVRGIYNRHWVEREAARASDAFTTVSEITAFEAFHLLGRQIDVIVPNGLNVQRFTALHEFQNLHAAYKDKIQKFVIGHFYGHMDFDLDKTLFFFTSGRYEYYNKGVNLVLDSLKQLNDILRRELPDITVVAFIIMPAPTNNFNVESLKGQSVVRDLRETCDSIVAKIAQKLFESALHGEVLTELSIPKQDEVMLKRRLVAIRSRPTLPPVVTHNMVNDSGDEILNHIRKVELFNDRADRVKVVFHPEFLSSTSTILPLDYPQFVRGCHLGLFPSYYEPWGYTPAECTVMGVPSVTSNLTGFANFISRRVETSSHDGIYIVDRRFRSYPESVTQMTNILFRFCSLSRRQRIQLRNRTERLSEKLDWNVLGRQYIKAWKKSHEKVFGSTLVLPYELQRESFDVPSTD